MSTTTYGWPVVPLRELCDIIIGRTPSRSNPTYWGRGRQWVTISDMGGADTVLSTAEQITQTAVSECGCREIPAGTLLMSFKLSIGKLAFAGMPLFTNEAIAALPIRDEARLNARYLLHALAAVDYLQGADRAAKGMTLNKAKLESLPVALPPLPEQQRIAAILDRADAIRRKRGETLRLADEFIKSAFLDTFGDPVTNREGWPVAKLKDLVRDGDPINYGVVQPGEHVAGGVPIVRVGDFHDGVIDRSEIKCIAREIEAQYARSRLVGDEVLIACVGTIGEVALADSSLAGCNIVRAVARVAIKGDVEREYVAAYLRLQIVQAYFRSETRTVSQPTLNIAHIRETDILMPPAALRRCFKALFERCQSHKACTSQAAHQTDGLFGSLVQRAFRGDL